MANSQSARMFTLVQRELQEYKGSLFWTPIIIAGALSTVMLVSVLLSDRISVLGDALMQVMLHEESVGGMSITINIDDDQPDLPPIQVDGGESAGDGAADVTVQTWRIEKEEGPVVEEDWNFSREWEFSPDIGPKSHPESEDMVESLNPVLNLMHNLLLLVLVIVTVNYLLGTLFHDRKDRSILFWKSMPVSEWEEVVAKLAVALVVAPAIYIAVSVLAQFIYILLAMLLSHRMELDPMELIVGNIEFGALLVTQLGGWIMTALWVAPAYAWLLLASAAAKRSPFMLALAPVLAAVVLESIFLGTNYVANAIINHVPHNNSGMSQVGFYFYGPNWSGIDVLSMGLGLVFAAAAIWAAVYFRRYRFEI